MKKIILSCILSLTVMFASPTLEEGTYSWFKGGSSASLTFTKEKNGVYAVKGDAYFGMARKYGPNMGNISFSAPLKNGKLVYEGSKEDKKSDYVLTLKVRKDGSFDVIEEGFPPFGHNVTMSGHFTSDDKPSFSCVKASTSVEHAICDNVAIARLDKKMAKAYAVVRSQLYVKHNYGKKGFDKDLKQKQRAWMKHRNKCISKKAYVSCLEHSYLKRIEELGKVNVWSYDE